MIIQIAATAGEWAQACRERDGYECKALDHDPRCRGAVEQVHHLVYKSHLTPETRWIVENGLSLSQVCHAKAHATHNASVGLTRANEAVKAVNIILVARGLTKIPPFRKKAA